MGQFLFLSVLFFFPALANAQIADAMCNFEPTAVKGLPKAICYFPSCPSGGDCTPPTLDASTSKIEFFEPLLEWKHKCPQGATESGCWEVYLDFKFRVAANDPAGVSFVGVNIAQEIDGQKVVKKYMTKAELLDPQGFYLLNGGMVLHVPPGRRLALAVSELCAKDNVGNEGCIPPTANENMKFQLGK